MDEKEMRIDHVQKRGVIVKATDVDDWPTKDSGCLLLRASLAK